MFHFGNLYPQPNYSTIKCLVSSGRQTTRSIKEESVVSVVLARCGWVFAIGRRASSELELSKEGGGEKGKGKDGVAEERFQRHLGARLSGQLSNHSKQNPAFYP